MAAKKTSETASVVQNEGNLKRSIQMKMFATKTQKAEVALAFEKGEPREKWEVPVGQIVGRIYEVNTSTFENSSGEMVEKIYASGEFEAVVYNDGEVMESPNADLPSYYLEGVRGALARNNNTAVLIGIEIVLVATGKAIPFAYEVRNLVPREADSPLNRLKAQIAAKGKLRLPPPETLLAIDPPEPETDDETETADA